MIKPINIQQVVKYGGHSINRAGLVNVTFVADSSELVGTIQTFQTLGEDVTIGVKVAGSQPERVGVFHVKSITTTNDGTTKLKFEALRENVEVDKLDRLPLMQDDVPAFRVMYKAKIEVEDA